MIGLLSKDARLLTGVEPDDDGSLRAYLGMRSVGIHTHVTDADARADITRAWESGALGHIWLNVPATALCDCPIEARS